MIFDKTKLLSVYDLTKDSEPMKTARVATAGTGPTHEVAARPTDGPILGGRP